MLVKLLKQYLSYLHLIKVGECIISSSLPKNESNDILTGLDSMLPATIEIIDLIIALFEDSLYTDEDFNTVAASVIYVLVWLLVDG